MADKLDLVFKKAVNRQYTSPDKAFYEELGAVPYKLKGSDIWVNPIPSTPPASSNDIIEKYTSLALVEDNTVANKQCWVVVSSGSDPTQNRIGDFISPRYGQGYTVVLKDGAGQQVFDTDASGWFFDYESGTLTFDNSPPGNNSVYTIDVYRYIGTTADDLVTYDETLDNLFIEHCKTQS